MNKNSFKQGWKTVKFGDVVNNANLVERDPVVAGIKRIVGLEHLDPENLHIRRWDSPEDGTSFTRKFVPGQTLFGKRRAYQRKVAFAEFEGICSGDILTFESKNPKILLSELLPFICQTDAFFNYALGTSAGSLSPRTSWSALQDFEFPLPPIEEQTSIAEILWAADEAVERYRSVKAQNEDLYLAQSESLLFDERHVLTTVESVASFNREVLLESKTPQAFEFRYIDIGSVIFPKVIGDLNTYLFSVAPSRARRCVKEADILLSTVRPNLRSFVRLPELSGPHIASTGFAVITPKNEIIGSLLFHAFFSRRFARYCEARVIGTSYPAISAKDIAKFKVFIPNDPDKQIFIQQLLDKLDDATRSIEDNTLKLFQMYKILVNQSITTEDAMFNEENTIEKMCIEL